MDFDNKLNTFRFGIENSLSSDKVLSKEQLIFLENDIYPIIDIHILSKIKNNKLYIEYPNIFWSIIENIDLKLNHKLDVKLSNNLSKTINHNLNLKELLQNIVYNDFKARYETLIQNHIKKHQYKTIINKKSILDFIIDTRFIVQSMCFNINIKGKVIFKSSLIHDLKIKVVYNSEIYAMDNTLITLMIQKLISN